MEKVEVIFGFSQFSWDLHYGGVLTVEISLNYTA